MSDPGKLQVLVQNKTTIPSRVILVKFQTNQHTIICCKVVLSLMFPSSEALAVVVMLISTVSVIVATPYRAKDVTE